MTTSPPSVDEDVGAAAERCGRAVWPALRSWASGRPGTGGVVLSVVVSAYGFAAGARPGGETWRERVGTGLAQLVVVAVVLTSVWVLERAVRRWGSELVVEEGARWWGRPEWRCPSPWAFAALAAGAGVSLAWDVIAPTVNRLWDHGPAGTYNELPNHHSATVWAAAVMMIVCAPVLEELLFRGCLQSWLARRIPSPVAVVVVAGGFAGAHGLGPGSYNSVQLVVIFVSGLVYGWLFHATRSVTPGIIAHAAYNGSILLALTTGAPSALPPVVIAVVGLAGLWAVRARQPGPEQRSYVA